MVSSLNSLKVLHRGWSTVGVPLRGILLVHMLLVACINRRLSIPAVQRAVRVLHGPKYLIP